MGFYTVISHILTCVDCANDEHLMSLLKDYRYAQNNPETLESELENYRSVISYYAAVNVYSANIA